MSKEFMLNILKETAEYYNANNRSVKQKSFEEACYYRLGEKACAIGRLLPYEIATKLDSMVGQSSINHINVWNTIKNIDPINKAPHYFWLDIQKLHDNKYYWNNNGLSDTGKKQVEFMENYINSGFYENYTNPVL